MDSLKYYDLVIFECESIGEGYEVINDLKGYLHVDLIPTGSGSVVMFVFEQDLLSSLATKSCFKLKSFKGILNNFSIDLIEAWQGAKTSSLQDVLGVFESNSTFSVFNFSKLAHESGFRVFDIRIIRGGLPKAYAMITGGFGQTTKAVLLDLAKKQSGTLCFIEKPSESLTSFFDLI